MFLSPFHEPSHYVVPDKLRRKEVGFLLEPGGLIKNADIVKGAYTAFRTKDCVTLIMAHDNPLQRVLGIVCNRFDAIPLKKEYLDCLPFT